MERIRCWWHIALGAGLPWLGRDICLVGSLGYIAYQGLQYMARTHKGEEDVNHLDIKEWLIALIISAVIKQVIGVLT